MTIYIYIPAPSKYPLYIYISLVPTISGSGIYVHIQIPYGSRGSPLLRPGAPADRGSLRHGVGPLRGGGRGSRRRGAVAAAAAVTGRHGEMVGKSLGNNMWNHGNFMRILWNIWNIMRIWWGKRPWITDFRVWRCARFLDKPEEEKMWNVSIEVVQKILTGHCWVWLTYLPKVSFCWLFVGYMLWKPWE